MPFVRKEVLQDLIQTGRAAADQCFTLKGNPATPDHTRLLLTKAYKDFDQAYNRYLVSIPTETVLPFRKTLAVDEEAKSWINC